MKRQIPVCVDSKMQTVLPRDEGTAYAIGFNAAFHDSIEFKKIS